jgi:hypothetical protein
MVIATRSMQEVRWSRKSRRGLRLADPCPRRGLAADRHRDEHRHPLGRPRSTPENVVARIVRERTEGNTGQKPQILHDNCLEVTIGSRRRARVPSTPFAGNLYSVRALVANYGPRLVRRQPATFGKST